MSTRKFWDPLLMWLQYSCKLEKFQQKNICYDKWINIFCFDMRPSWGVKKSQQHCQDFLLHILGLWTPLIAVLKLVAKDYNFCRHSLNSAESLCWHLEKRLEYTKNSFTSRRLMLLKIPHPKFCIPITPPSNHFWRFNRTNACSCMFNSLGGHIRSGLGVADFHRVWAGSWYTEQLGDLRINGSLTDAVLALYFIPWGTDASEGPLQILTGTGRTRARKGYTFIGIFKEKQNKNYSKMR